MARDISNTDKILDSRVVEGRIDDLLDELKDEYAAYCRDDVPDGDRPLAFTVWLSGDHEEEDVPEPDDAEEYREILKFAKQGRGYGDWRNGETLIHDDHFEAYAEEYARDSGSINANADWPNNCIDWKQAADELKVDYTSIEWDGETYWMRS